MKRVEKMEEGEEDEADREQVAEFVAIVIYESLCSSSECEIRKNAP